MPRRKIPRYPLSSDYDRILKNITQFARTPMLQAIQPVRPHGAAISTSLLAFPGGYSRVYKVTSDGRSLALRCWTKDPGRVQERYSIVRTYLAQHPLPCFVDFDYIEDALGYDDRILPVSWINWVDGPTLSDFIRDEIDNTARLRQTASAFSDMVNGLHQHQISHGDLQDGNLKVNIANDKIRLTLLDYDSLYVPSLPEELLDELPGIPAYQHPRRDACGWKKLREKADYFSELVIYLSLRVYASNPEEWKDEEKKLLFDSADFESPHQSSLFTRLQEHTNNEIRFLSRTLMEYCEQSPVDLPPLEQALRLEGQTAQKEAGSAAPSRSYKVKPVVSPASQKIRSGVFQSFEEDAVCPKGHKRISAEDVYCTICGDKQAIFGKTRICSACQDRIPHQESFHFCPNCGRRL